jgi:hypothetical protein
VAVRGRRADAGIRIGQTDAVRWTNCVVWAENVRSAAGDPAIPLSADKKRTESSNAPGDPCLLHLRREVRVTIRRGTPRPESVELSGYGRLRKTFLGTGADWDQGPLAFAGLAFDRLGSVG